MKSIFRKTSMAFTVLLLSLFSFVSCEEDTLVSENAISLKIEDSIYADVESNNSEDLSRLFCIVANDVTEEINIFVVLKEDSSVSFPQNNYDITGEFDDPFYIQYGEAMIDVYDKENDCIGVSGTVRVTGNAEDVKIEVSVVLDNNTVKEFVYEGPIEFVYEPDFG